MTKVLLFLAALFGGISLCRGADGRALENAERLNVDLLNTVVALALELPRVESGLPRMDSVLIKERFAQHPEYSRVYSALRSVETRMNGRVTVQISEMTDGIGLLIGVVTKESSIGYRYRLEFTNGVLTRVTGALEGW
jgi:hypothetical protein